MSEVSRHNQTIPRIEINGSDAISPPKPGYLVANSEMIATIILERRALIIRYVSWRLAMRTFAAFAITLFILGSAQAHVSFGVGR